MTTPSKESAMLAIGPARYVTVAGAAAAMGLSEEAVRTRLARGVWLEDKQWRRAPDNRIWIDLKAIEAWIESKGATNGR